MYQNAINQNGQKIINYMADREGDSLTFVMHPNASYFYYNSKYVGNIHDPTIGPAFADIWLSDTSEYPKIQKKLIGLQY